MNADTLSLVIGGVSSGGGSTRRLDSEIRATESAHVFPD